MEEKKIERIQLGKMAEAMWPHFVPLIRKKREEALIRIKELYRKDATDSNLYIAQAAILTAFDDLISDIERQIKRSRDQEKELLNGRELADRDPTNR